MRLSACLILCCFIIPKNGFAQRYPDSLFVLYFPNNSYYIDDHQLRQLESLKQVTDTIEMIRGYADSTGTSAYNMRLSTRRAREVSRIVDSLHFTIIGETTGYGELTTGTTDLAKNRKVEIIIPVSGRATVNNISYPDSVYEVLTIDNIFFIPDKDEIQPASFDAVNDLGSKLKRYQNSNFEILGHINYQSRRDSSHLTDLYNLSERRAKRIFELLVDQGIPASVMTYRGMGNSQPVIAKPKNDEERKKNMRVEVRIRKTATP
jgi:outer membrane protein OmpA-like peptidoglycan-associated protein